MKRINIMKMIRLGMQEWGKFSEKNASNYAASTAFFFFISLIPMCILLSRLLPQTGIEQETFIKMVTRYTPDIIDGLVTNIIVEAFKSAGNIVPLSALTLIYTACKGMLSLMQGMNIIYGIHEHRGYVRLVFVAIFYMTALLVFTVAFFILVVSGESIYSFVEEKIPSLESVTAQILGLRGIVMIATSVVMFLLMYTFLPAKKQKFMMQLPGAIFSAVGWWVFSRFFSLFMNSGSIYSTYYGSLATIAIFLMWLYGCFYITLFGGYLNYILPALFIDCLRFRKKIKEQKE